MWNRVKGLIDKGQVEDLTALLARKPDLATRKILWGIPRCKAEPLHYLSDGFFNCRWDHGREGLLAEVLIKAGASVEGSNTSNGTHLHGAVSLGCRDVAKVLLLHGADIEAVGIHPGIPDGTPLDFAVHFGMTELVELLVQHGAEIKSARMAAGTGQVSMTLSLLERSPDKSETFTNDVLRCAAVCNQLEVVEQLLAMGTDVNTNISGATALHWAAWEAKLPMVKYLIERGANVSTEDQSHGMTPLGWAQHRRKEVGTRWGHDGVIEFLIDVRSPERHVQ